MSADGENVDGVELRRLMGRSLRALGSDLDRLDEAVAARFGLHRTDLRCLEIVAREGPLSAGELAGQAGLSTSAVTSMIDRVQRLGYLRRRGDPDDRRRVLVEVTELGRERGREAFSGLMRETDRLLGGYSLDELRVLAGFVSGVRSVVVEQAIEAIAVGSRTRRPESGSQR